MGGRTSGKKGKVKQQTLKSRAERRLGEGRKEEEENGARRVSGEPPAQESHKRPGRARVGGEGAPGPGGQAARSRSRSAHRLPSQGRIVAVKLRTSPQVKNGAPYPSR